MKRFDSKCALSGDSNIHLDHVIPLKVGRGGTVYGNIIPLSYKLNSSKQDKNIFEWFKSTKNENNLSEEKFNDLIAYLAECNNMSVKEYKEYVCWCHNNPVDLYKS